jgi:20S proteasome alpha/beta subunit
MIIGGWDKYEGGQIFSVPLGGTIMRQPFAIGGTCPYTHMLPFLLRLHL